MAKVMVVTSGKGGVGKTTSTAALGAALAQAGQKVAVVDFDVGLRNLDLVMGAERRVVYDLINVVQGEAQACPGADQRQADRNAVPAAGLADARQGRADRGGRRAGSSRSCARSSTGSSATARPASSAARSWRCATRISRSWSPTRKSRRSAMPTASSACSTRRPTAAEKGEKMEKHLLLTRYDASRAERGEMLRIDDVLEILSIPLLGIMPESQEVLRSVECRRAGRSSTTPIARPRELMPKSPSGSAARSCR